MTAARTGQTLGPDSPIPNKLYFKIGEVSQLVGVRAHVLRYWEKEISSIRPSKSASNQRRYRRRDVELFREIRRLLYEERYTLAGARKRLLSGGRAEKAPATEVAPAANETEPTLTDVTAPALTDVSAPAAIEPLETAEPEPEESIPAAGAERLAHDGDQQLIPGVKPVTDVVSEAEEPADAPIPQLALGFVPPQDAERLERVRDGLREIIRLASDE